MKVSLISTVYNEAANIREYLDSILGLGRLPDEFVVVDAGSGDGTVEELRRFAAAAPFPVQVLGEKGCNIARGRNIAIGRAAYDIIAVSDAGCRLDREWLAELTGPLCSPDVDVVGGWYEADARSAFEKAAALCTFGKLSKVNAENFLPSSRSIAFTRKAWASVGGYPEWLTLTAEDTLFDLELKRGGCRFAFAPRAVVRWRPRQDLGSLLRQFYLYGVGDGEAGIGGTYRKAAARVCWAALVVPGALLFNAAVSLLALAPLVVSYARNLTTVCDRHVPQALALSLLIDAARLWGWLKGRLRRKTPSKKPCR